MDKVPNHIALIIDGNRRWAKEKKLPSYRGHSAGAENFEKFCDWCKNKGVKIITAYILSTENLNRSKIEVRFLLKIIENYLKDGGDDRPTGGDKRKVCTGLRLVN